MRQRPLMRQAWVLMTCLSESSMPLARGVLNLNAMENILKLMKTFLAIGKMTETDDTPIEEKVKYRQRIVFATMKKLIPEWKQPPDWYMLSDEEKLKRLDYLEKVSTPVKNEK